MAEQEGIGPSVVERAPDSAAALAAIIAQELERSGFAIGDRYAADGGGTTIEVETPRRRFTVTVE